MKWLIITFFIEEEKVFYLSLKYEIIEGEVTSSPALSPLSNIYVKLEAVWLH